MSTGRYVCAAVHCGLISVEATVITFLIYQRWKPKSIFTSGYFKILTAGYIVDFIFGIVYIENRFFGYPKKTAMMPITLYIEWVQMMGCATLELILGINRGMSLAFPVTYSKVWSKNATWAWILFIILSPYIIDGYSFSNSLCKWWDYYEPNCTAFATYEGTLATIYGLICGLISLTIIFIGIFMSPKILSQNNADRTKMERRLVLQTILSTSAMMLYLIVCAFIDFFRSHGLGYFIHLFYLIQIYPSLFFLFYASKTFRNEYFKFYKLGIFIRKLHSTHVTKISGVKITSQPNGK